MASSDIKKKVCEFAREYQIVDVTVDSLMDAIRRQGYTIIEFSHIINDDDVALIIEALNLSEMISHANGFTFMDSEHRLLFLNEDLSDEETKMVLAHEEGHIFLNHLSNNNVVGQDVKDEYNANEFAHFLLKSKHKSSIRNVIGDYRGAIITFVIILAVFVVGILLTAKSSSDSLPGEYYVTATGKRYHKADCVFVKNKSDVHLMTEEEYAAGKYTPCQVCLPD